MVLVSLLHLVLRRSAEDMPRGPRRAGVILGRLGRLRREVLPTDDELDRRYLEEARDLCDLEWRMRQLDRSRQPTHGSLYPFRRR